MKCLENEVLDLKEQLIQERRTRISLEEQLDLLAIENERLRGELLLNMSKNENQEYNEINIPTKKEDANDFLENLLKEGDGLFPQSIAMQYSNACQGTNVTCVTYCNLSYDSEIIVAGGANKTLYGYSMENFTTIFTFTFSAPIIAVTSHGSVIACSMMDGSHAVLDVNDPNPDNVIHIKDHTKYVVCIQFSPDGQFLATASHDKSVNLYRRSEGVLKFEKIQTLRFMANPEHLIFAPIISLDSSNGISECKSPMESAPWNVIIALRETHYLIYLNTNTFQEEHITMNEKLWDTHASFTALHLCLSPNEKMILIATDKHFHIVCKLGSNERLRTFCGGHTCGDYGRPRVAWDITSRYIYTNSDGDHSIYIYSVSSEKIIAELTGHAGSIRDIKVHSSKRQFITASFDHSVIVWE